MHSPSENGMIHLASSYSTPRTVERLEALLAERKIPLAARVSHGKAANEVGIPMKASELFIFGNPKSGSPLMLAAPTLAIDLPLKALIWEDHEGKVWVSYNTPEYLGKRHHVPDDLLQNIAGIHSMLEEVVRKTSAKPSLTCT
jgi:uncharacterized protein (DUF302 family)